MCTSVNKRSCGVVARMMIRSTVERTFTWVFVKNVDADDSSDVTLKNDWAKVYSVHISNTKDSGAVACQKCPKGSDNQGSVKVYNYRCGCCPCNTSTFTLFRLNQLLCDVDKREILTNRPCAHGT